MQVAHKVWIGSISGGNVVFNGDKFVSVEISDRQVSRVNLIANVVDVYSNDEKRYNSVTLDDGSGQIRIKGFSDSSFLLQGISIGDTIGVIGWVRYFNNELYVIPDIVRHVDGKWALIRRLELIKMHGGPSASPATDELSPAHHLNSESNSGSSVMEEVKTEKIQDAKTQDPRQIILSIIKKDDQGIDIDKLIMETNFPIEQINSILTSLMESGDIYEPQPGKLRTL